MSLGRKIAIGVAAVVVVFVVFALVNAFLAERETRAAEADVGRILTLPGADLQVTDDGPRRARAVVLLHGWTESLHIWDPDLPRLDRRLRVIRVDLPGSGGSEAPTSGYSIPDQARQVARALDRLGVRRAVVVGHSMGGDVAVQLAASRPGLVSGLVLVDSPAAPGYQHPSFLIESSLWPIAGPLAHNFSTDSLKREALKVAVAPGAEVPQQMVDDEDRVTWPAYKQGYDGTNSWVDERAVPSRLRSLHIPVLVIWGRKDQLVDPDSVALYRSVPRVRAATLPGVGHTPPLEAPAATARLIRAFALERQERKRR
jgi:pimeloyl-ACP methyl ester carboxylesterase